jgi:hypothetical protein
MMDESSTQNFGRETRRKGTSWKTTAKREGKIKVVVKGKDQWLLAARHAELCGTQEFFEINNLQIKLELRLTSQ